MTDFRALADETLKTLGVKVEEQPWREQWTVPFWHITRLELIQKHAQRALADWGKDDRQTKIDMQIIRNLALLLRVEVGAPDAIEQAYITTED